MIHVICTDVSGVDRDLYTKLYDKATPERKIRADRYRSMEDSIRCVVADGLLRHVLGTDQYTVEKYREGKPCILGKPDFHFNLSHSGNWVVIAYGNSEVGIDVEQIRTSVNIDSIGKRFFSPEEQRYVFEEKKNIQRHFYEVWTAKESYIKFLGTGLRKDLTSFSVFSLESDVCIQQLWLDEDSCVSLCANETEYLLEQLNAEQLI